MQTLILWCASVRAALESVHPIAPWAVLALLCFGADAALKRFGWARWLEQRVPWGKTATALLAGLPATILGAAWPAVTSGDTDPASAVKGTVARLAAPLALAVWAWLPKSPPGSGAAAAVVLALPMLTGCDAIGLAPAQNPERDECLAKVVVEMANRANAECLARGLPLNECPARDSIVADSLARNLSCLQ